MNVNNIQDRRNRGAPAASHQSVKMEALERFASHVTHDFNNLIAIIINNIEWVIEDGIDQRHMRRLMLAQRGAERAVNLVQDLQKVWGRQALNRTVNDVNKVVADFLTDFETKSDRSIQLVRRLGDALPAIFLDPANLCDALSKLATNACEAMPEGGQLVVETAEDFIDDDRASLMATDLVGPCVAIRVRDTGLGMSADVATRAFEPFFTTKNGGDGLGLTKVYNFVRQSGGHIQIESVQGRGTTIILFFPVLSEQEHN